MPNFSVPYDAKVVQEVKQKKKIDRAIKEDIEKIGDALASYDIEKLRETHRYIDGKYQSAINNWGQSLYKYVPNYGFCHANLNESDLQGNLLTMKAKLEGLIQGLNSNTLPVSTPNLGNSADVNVTVNNNMLVNITFEQAREKIEEMTSLTHNQTKEILERIDEIESIIKEDDSKKTKWEKFKPILTWLADKSFDVAMTILPLLLKMQ